MKKRSLVLSLVISVFLTLSLYSCGGSGGGSGSGNFSSSQVSSKDVSVTGTVSSSSYTIASNGNIIDKILNFFTERKVIAASGEEVNAIWGLPTLKGEISPESFKYKVNIPINADGTFTVNLPKTATISLGGKQVTLNLGWILLLVNTNAKSKKDMIVGYITLSDSSDSLLWMPISDALGNINLGVLSQNGNEARSSATLSDEAGTFSLSLDQLEQIAKSDDVLKNIKNIFMNYNENTGEYWILQPYFGWNDNPSSIKNQWSNPDNLSFYGYAFYLSTNDTTNPTFSDVCQGNEIMRLYPPTTIHLIDNVSASFDNSTPIYTEKAPIETDSGGTQECSGKYFYLSKDNDSIEPGYMYNFIVGDSNLLAPDNQTQRIPSGYWTLKMYDNNTGNESTVAMFDLAVASPFDSEGNPTIFFPSVKVNVDDNDTIQSIQIKFYTFGSSGWAEVTDPTVIDKMFSELAISLDYYGGSQRIEDNYYIIGEDNIFDNSSLTLPITIDASKLKHTWKFSDYNGSKEPVAESISIGYSMGNVNFRFVWRNKIPG